LFFIYLWKSTYVQFLYEVPIGYGSVILKLSKTTLNLPESGETVGGVWKTDYCTLSIGKERG
jgi:hypothetical protein